MLKLHVDSLSTNYLVIFRQRLVVSVDFHVEDYIQRRLNFDH
jgi:hypothetical protein